MLMVFGLTYPRAGFAQEITPLQVIKNVPIVKGTINGITAYFIVDTGSTITVLNEGLQYQYGFSVVKNRFWNKRCVIGMGGRCYLKQVDDVIVGLGGMHLEFVNKSSDLTMLSAQFAAHDIEIAGIIGNDLLCFLGSRIDLHARTIVFMPDNKPMKAFVAER